mgnify:CR=1 FL=1
MSMSAEQIDNVQFRVHLASYNCLLECLPVYWIEVNK